MDTRREVMKVRLQKVGEVIVLILSIGIVLGAIYLSGRAYAAPPGGAGSGTGTAAPVSYACRAGDKAAQTIGQRPPRSLSNN